MSNKIIIKLNYKTNGSAGCREVSHPSANPVVKKPKVTHLTLYVLITKHTYNNGTVNISTIFTVHVSYSPANCVVV